MEGGTEVDGGRRPFLAALPPFKARKGGEAAGQLLGELVSSRSKRVRVRKVSAMAVWESLG